MKINILAGPSFPIPTVIGGAVQKRWVIVAEEFVKLGHEVVMYSRRYDNFPNEEVINGVRHIRYGGFSQSKNVLVDLVKDFFYAIGMLKVIESADITITNDFWLPFFTSKRKIYGKTVVNVGRYPKKQFFLYNNVDAVISVSKAIQNAVLDQAPYLKNKCFIVGNPLNNKYFDLDFEQTIKKKKKGSFLYVGRIHQEKGIDILIEAFKKMYVKHKNINLTIVGPWREEQGGSGKKYGEYLKKIATEYPVEFKEPIFDVSELIETYAKAEIFCYPSLAEKGEAFGIAPLEAMTTGAIPVLSALECFQDYLENKKNGFIFDHSSEHRVENLYQSLELALKNLTNHEIKINAYETSKHFTVDKIADQFIKIFKYL